MRGRNFLPQSCLRGTRDHVPGLRDGAAIQAVAHGCYKNSRLATATVVLADTAHRQAWRTMVSAYMFISAAQRDLLAGLDLTQERVFVRHNLIPARHLQASPTRTQPASTVDLRRTTRRSQRRPPPMVGWDHYLTTNPNPGLTLTIAGPHLRPEITTWAATRPTVHLAGHADPAAAPNSCPAPAPSSSPRLGRTLRPRRHRSHGPRRPPRRRQPRRLHRTHHPRRRRHLFDPGNPQALATAITDIQDNPRRYRTYGEQARDTYTEKILPRPQHRPAINAPASPSPTQPDTWRPRYTSPQMGNSRPGGLPRTSPGLTQVSRPAWTRLAHKPVRS